MTTIDLPEGYSLEEWNTAYRKVEDYLCSFRIGNRLLSAQLSLNILQNAIDRSRAEPGRSATELATEEAVRAVNEWCSQVLGCDPSDTPGRVSTQGRLGLLLAGMPDRYQALFLSPPPWPEPFVRGMRDSYLRAGPDFQISQMKPRDIDLGPVKQFTALARRPYLRMVLLWAAMTAALIVLFILTHRG